jgi:hypothetical protein
MKRFGNDTASQAAGAQDSYQGTALAVPQTAKQDAGFSPVGTLRVPSRVYEMASRLGSN